MATSNWRSLSDWRDRETLVEQIAQAINAYPGRPIRPLAPLGHAASGTGELRPPAPERGSEDDQRADAERRRGTRWNRIVARITRGQPSTVAEGAADIDQSVTRYNAVLTERGEPTMDLDDLMGKQRE